jgi:hypothetical protein
MISLRQSLFIVGMILFTLYNSQTQSLDRDILYLKSGGILRGLIFEMFPDKEVKIQTPDSIISVYSMFDVEKIVMEGRTFVPTIQPKPKGKTLEAYIGLAFPSGGFAANSSIFGGYVKNGLGIGISGNLNLTTYLAWSSSVILTENPCDEKAVTRHYYNDTMALHLGNWTSVFVLTGFRMYDALTPDIEYFTSAQIGLMGGYSPEISSLYYDVSSVSATSICYGLGMGINAYNIGVAVRYLGGAPEYIYTSGERVLKRYTQQTSLFLLTVGISF